MSTWESCYRHTLLSVIWSYNKGNNFKHPSFKILSPEYVSFKKCYFLTHYQNQNYQNVSFILKEVIKCIYLFESIFQTAYPYSHLSFQKKMANLEHDVLYKKICNTFILNKSFMYFVTNRKKTLFVIQKITMVISHFITKYCTRVFILKILSSWKVNYIFNISSFWCTSGFSFFAGTSWLRMISAGFHMWKCFCDFIPEYFLFHLKQPFH